MAKLQSYKGSEPYIFISYAHKDNAAVHPIIERMQNDGYRVWFDEGIDPGTEWDENIANHINECGYFIALISKNYLASNNCKDELNYARDLSKKRVLVYLEQVSLTSGMAMRMNRIQSIFKYTYSNENDFYEKLYESDDIDGFTSGKNPASVGQTAVRAQQTTGQRAKAATAAEVKTITYADGSTYTGEVNAAGLRHGRGTYCFFNGDVYEGDFKDDKFHGYGTLRYADGDVYEGEYRNNLRNGYGTYRFASGTVYEGEFKDGKRNGHGIYRSVNGTVYEGEFKDGKRNGHGILRFASRTVYEGDFKEDKFHGHGTYRFADGDVYEGDFKDDKFHGEGVMRYANGDVKRGRWENGTFVG